jgi:DNA-binding MarR family transcriptional regulator
VERRRHKSDRRTTLAHITDLGRELVHRATDVLNAQGFGVSALSDGEMKDLIELVRTLRSHAGDPVPSRTTTGAP